MIINNNSNECILDKPIPIWIINILIIYSVICFSIETIPVLSTFSLKFLHYSEIIIITIFTIEYLYRFFSAPSKLKFIFSFYGLIDLLAILPFYLTTAIDLRSARLLRLFRLFRILKIVRYNQSIQRFLKALYLVKEDLLLFTLASLIMIYFSATGIYHFEHEAQPDVFRSIFDCLWWAISTLTTVGYGDIYPITTGGRIFTFVILMVGVSIIAVPTAIVASALTVAREEQLKKTFS